MAVHIDPEDRETAALFDFAGDFGGKQVLEIGCGDGRLTWRYAGAAASVLAIDPDPERIARAQANMPAQLAARVSFLATGLESFQPPAPVDVALLSWSL